MRVNLQPLNGKRGVFRATVGRRDVFKTPTGMRQKVLLKDLMDAENQTLAEHVSIADPVSVKEMMFLMDGDLIQFTAIVYEYIKGYKGQELELRLSHPISVDYSLWDVRDIIKLNLCPRKPQLRMYPSLEYLKKGKRIRMGVCL